MKLLNAFDNIVKHHNQTGKLPLNQMGAMQGQISKAMNHLAFAGSDPAKTAQLANRLNTTTLVDHAVYANESRRSNFRKLLRVIDQETEDA